MCVCVCLFNMNNGFNFDFKLSTRIEINRLAVKTENRLEFYRIDLYLSAVCIIGAAKQTATNRVPLHRSVANEYETLSNDS